MIYSRVLLNAFVYTSTENEKLKYLQTKQNTILYNIDTPKMDRTSFINYVFRLWIEKKIHIQDVIHLTELNGYHINFVIQHHIIQHSFSKIKIACESLFPIRAVRSLFEYLEKRTYRDPGIWCVGDLLSNERIVLCNLSKLPTGNWFRDKYAYSLNYYVIDIT